MSNKGKFDRPHRFRVVEVSGYSCQHDNNNFNSIKYILDFRFHKPQHVHKWRYNGTNGSSHELVVFPCEKEEDPSASEESRTEARIPDRDG